MERPAALKTLLRKMALWFIINRPKAVFAAFGLELRLKSYHFYVSAYRVRAVSFF